MQKKNIKIICELDNRVIDWIGSQRGEDAIKTDIETKLASFDDDSQGNFDVEKSYSGIKARISGDRSRMSLKRRHIDRWAAIAIILLVLSAGGRRFYSTNYLTGTDSSRITRYTADVKLILSDGSEIVLDRSTENSRVAEHNDVVLTRENGVLMYKKQLTQKSVAGEPLWSTIVVPRGSRFDLVLEDGTKVWLNADSRLRFPLMFSEGEREVFLEGEAYFTVVKNSEKLFIVTTPTQNIKVLGTEFNVCAYNNRSAEYTTLIEGSVSLNPVGSQQSIILLPEQQAILTGGTGKYIVHNISARDMTAWRNGVFVFESNSLDEVFFKLSKWYDFEYSFEEAKLAEFTFSGNLHQIDDVSGIFEIIETIGQIEIKTTGRSVRIGRK